MNLRQALFRTLGKVCPPVGRIEHGVCRQLQRWVPHGAGGPAVGAGNGFVLTGDTSNAAFLTGLHERAWMSVLAEHIQAGEMVYDVGANTGYLALWLQQHFADRNCALEIVAFEPEPANFAWLRDNLALNRANDSIQAEPIALGAKSGSLTLWTAGRGDGSVSADPGWGASVARKPVEVRVETVDEFRARSGRPPPNWIILDVEGFGHDVIAGAEQTIATSGPAVAAEIHTPTERGGIEARLLPAGYRLVRELRSSWGTHVLWQRSRS